MAQPAKGISKLADTSGNPQVGDRGSAIADTVDALDGATLTGDTLTTSATPTVTELEANDGVLGGKINAIMAALRLHGLLAD